MKGTAGTAVSRHEELSHAEDEAKPTSGDAIQMKSQPDAEAADAGSAPTAAKAASGRVPAMASNVSASGRKSSSIEDIDDADESDDEDEDDDVIASSPDDEDDNAEEEEEAPSSSSPSSTPAATPRQPQHGPVHYPRPMAKAEVFVEGDHVVYPTHGVGKVERIATEEIAGHKLELIHITFEENRMTLRVPVAKARTAGLRKLATRKMFDEALAVLKGRARIKRTMWSRRAQEYEAKINSGDPLAIAEVVRDLHRNAGQPDQSFSERQIYEAAMDRLAAELAALDKTDKTTAVTKLADFLKTV
jgi:CarD family transcriptional regulator